MAAKQGKEEVVSNALDALKALDQDTVDRYFSYDEFMDYDESASTTMKDENIALFFSKLDYNIVSSEIDGDTATVTAEITNIDFEAIIEDYFEAVIQLAIEQALLPEESQLSEEELQLQIEQLLFDLIENEDQTTTTTIEINLVKNHHSWTITMDEQLGDAILGGLISAFGGLLG